MRKRALIFTAIILTLTLAVCALAACNPESTENAENTAPAIESFVFQLKSSGDSYTLLSSLKSAESIKEFDIPAEYEGLPVTSIEMSAFSECSSMVKVTIPATVTSIGTSAFSGCSSLQTVSVADDNPSFKSTDGVLYSKNGSSLIYYPAGKTSSSFTVPEGVQQLSWGAFGKCNALKTVHLADSVTNIQTYAFSGCTATVVWGENSKMTSIGSYAFANYGGSEMTVPEGIISISEQAFTYSKLQKIHIPATVTSIGSLAFDNCKSLTEIDVAADNTVCKSIDGNLYTKDGTALVQYAAGKTDKSFVVPTGVQIISRRAFYACPSLETVTLPASLTTIGNEAMAECYALTTVNFSGTVSQFNRISLPTRKDWNFRSPFKSVICSDGTVTL